MYDFDKEYPRVGWASSKWDAAIKRGCKSTPLTVADMEFKTAPEIIEEVKAAADFGLWGYTYGDADFKAAVCGWMQSRHGWAAQPEWLVCSPGVVPSMYVAVRAFTQPGDGVIIQPPAYPPFFHSVRQNGRTVLENPLLYENGTWSMDLEGLARIAPKASMLLLCSPHNPVGRVWTREELTAVAQICHKHNVLVFADEIHCDLLMPGVKFTPWAALGEKYLPGAVIGTAASKTFSLAGLSCSSIFLPDAEKRRAFRTQMDRDGIECNTFFGMVATKAAYRKGGPWLDELLAYIWDNAEYLRAFLQQNLPAVSMSRLEGTYLAWLDFRALGLTEQQLCEKLEGQGSVFLGHGSAYGAEGEGFLRINLACPRSVLERTLQKLCDLMQ